MRIPFLPLKLRFDAILSENEHFPPQHARFACQQMITKAQLNGGFNICRLFSGADS